MSRILIVEDSEAMRETFVSVLGAAGYETMVAADGLAALDILGRGEAFDAVLTDIIMPGMDGIETIMEIQALRPGLPIVAVSGGSARTDKAKGLETARALGAAATLEKPFTALQLLKAVASVLP